MMKGGNYCSVKGKQLFLTLLVLILTTIYLLTWERTPFYTSLLLAKDRYTVPSPDLLLDAQNSSSLSLKSEKQNEESSFSSVSKETKTPEFSGAPMNSASMSSPKSNSAPTKPIKSSPESKGGTPMNLVTASSSENASVAPAHLASTSSPESKGGVPRNLTSASSPGSKGLAVNITSSSKTKVCNYARGRWIADSKRPLYSGFACKQWLSEMWACRMTQRKDFSYEGYRWQPENCEMPKFEESAFLRKMQDKTIAFIGDSLGRQQFQSLMCMATGGEYNMLVQDVGKEYGLVKARGAIRPDGWAYRFPTTNTTILYYWSASLSDLVPLNSSDKTSDVAMHLDRPPAFMRQYLPRFDVLVLNTGHHWNRGKLKANRWVMHVNGKPNEDTSPDAIVNAKNLTVYSVVRWLDSQLPSHPGLKAFFRTISPRHFKSGDWNSGGNCDNTIPLSGGSEVLEDGSSDPLVEGAVRGTKVKILDITAISQLRDEGHISRYTFRGTQNSSDCLHWCLPGVPDTWNELLIAQI